MVYSIELLHLKGRKNLTDHLVEDLHFTRGTLKPTKLDGFSKIIGVVTFSYIY
jgi:hypothetical protein